MVHDSWLQYTPRKQCEKTMKKQWKKQYIYIYMYVCIISVTKMVFVETVLTASDCIMTVRFGIVWNGLDGFIL